MSFPDEHFLLVPLDHEVESRRSLWVGRVLVRLGFYLGQEEDLDGFGQSWDEVLGKRLKQSFDEEEGDGGGGGDGVSSVAF